MIGLGSVRVGGSGWGDSEKIIVNIENVFERFIEVELTDKESCFFLGFCMNLWFLFRFLYELVVSF